MSYIMSVCYCFVAHAGHDGYCCGPRAVVALSQRRSPPSGMCIAPRAHMFRVEHRLPKAPLAHPPATSHAYLCPLVGGTSWPSLALSLCRGVDTCMVRSCGLHLQLAELLKA